MPPYVKDLGRWPFAAAIRSGTESHAFLCDGSNGHGGEWIEEEWVGSYLVACMWIYTNAVLCDGRRRDPPL